MRNQIEQEDKEYVNHKPTQFGMGAKIEDGERRGYTPYPLDLDIGYKPDSELFKTPFKVAMKQHEAPEVVEVRGKFCSFIRI